MADVPSVSNLDAASSEFEEFYGEVKEIEKRDSVLTSKLQLDRLGRPGSTYFNLNPFDVLQVDPDTPLPEIKKKYRQMSLLCHPDKNPDDKERAEKGFEALNKAYKTLENEEGYKRCQEIVQEARVRVDDMMEKKRKHQRKEGRGKVIDEDDPIKYRHAVYVQTCKLFADLERLRVEQETRAANERKRKAETEQEEKEGKEIDKEWSRNYDDSRTERVNSWRDFYKPSETKKKKKAKWLGGLKPPKTRMEERPSK